jgi:ABC-type transport system substrate-binding protein
VDLCFGLDDPGAALSAGRVDACFNMSGAWFEELGRERGYWLAGGAGETLYALFPNLRETGTGSRAVLRDTNVRLAMDYCLDRADVLNMAFGGGVPRNGWLGADSPWSYEGALSSLRNYSPDSAAWLLENTGYTDPDGDGVREDAYGSRLSFTLLCSSADPAWERAGELLRVSFASAGIELTVSAVPANELLEKTAAGDFDLLLTGLRPGADPATALRGFYGHRDNAFSLGIASPGWNFSGYGSKEADSLYTALLAAEPNALREPAAALGQLLYDEAAALPIGFGAAYQACSGTWEGLLLCRGSGVWFNPYTLRQQIMSITPVGSHTERNRG